MGFRADGAILITKLPPTNQRATKESPSDNSAVGIPAILPLANQPPTPPKDNPSRHNTRMLIDGLTVTVTRKPIKNMYLRIKPPNGEVVISAPRHTSDATIIEFVRGRRTWIDRNRQRMRRAREQSVSQQIGSQPGGALLGGDLPAKDTLPEGARGERPNMPMPSENTDEQTPNTTFIWTDAARNRAAANINAQLPELLRKWQPIIGRAPTHITLRVMTTRWGSCTPKTGRIRLNLQLGLMPPQLLEYVLVHEMTHLWERGHGPGFQRRMSAYLPNWKQLRRELNRCVVL